MLSCVAFGWGRPAGTIAAGVLAAAGLGKVAPVDAGVQEAFGLSALLLGLAISAIALVTSLFAAPIGEWLRARQPSRWLVIGLAVMTGAGFTMAASAPSAAALISLRAVEGIGYLLIMVGGPVVLLAQVRPDQQSLALALWGACIPAGLAVSAIAGPAVEACAGWDGWFATLAISCGLLAAVVWAGRGRVVVAAPVRRDGRRTGLAKPLLLAAGFSAVALVGVAVVSLLPAYLRSSSLAGTTAGLLTSAVAIASVPGSVFAGVLLRRGVSARSLGMTALLCPVFAFVTFARSLPLAVTVAAAVVLLFIVGTVVAAAYGALPMVVRHHEDLSLANGMLVQLGSAGTLLAPPSYAAVTGLHRWHLVGYLVLLTSAAGVLLLNRATSRPAPAMMPNKE